MADTATETADQEILNDDHPNHYGVDSITPDDHHNDLRLNNISSHNSLDHGINGDGIEAQPRYLMNSNRGKISNFYVNGDKFFPGKKIVHNPKYFKDLPHYLDYLTDKLEPRFGAIRKICTPKQGHRVLSLQDIRENCDYVVVGAERFKPFQYDQITPSERKKSPPFKYDANPVIHNRRLLQSGKINKIETRSKIIKVWPNGDDLRAPRRVLLTPRINPFTLVNVIAAVNEAIKEDCVGTVEKLYFPNGIKVSDVDQISHNGLYVACRKTDRFKNCRYQESATKNLSTSPRLERKFLPPLNYSRSNNSTHSSPEHSNASTQNSINGHPPRRRVARRDDDQVYFPAKAVKHTRSSEKTRTVDLDKDQGGMFKAKQNNRTTQGAREVQETRQTRTELPVDQRQAKTVENEVIDAEDVHSWTRSSRSEQEEQVGVVTKASHAPAHRRQEEKLPKSKKPTNGTRNGPPSQGGGIEARANSKRSPPASQQQQQKQQQQRQKRSREADRDDFERQKSAAKIQAGYRGYKTRQELKSNKRQAASPPPPASNNRVEDNDSRNNRNDYVEEKSPGRQTEPEARGVQQEDTLLGEEERAAAKIQAGYRGFQTRRKMQEKKAEQEWEARRREEEERAATKIQAGYRGFSSRKNTANSLMAELQPSEPVRADSPPPTYNDRQDQRTPPREDSYDSLDREISAATKIQSSFRGYQARKEYVRNREAAK